MLSNLASILDIVMARAVFGAAALFWQNPVACMVVLSALLGLSTILWLEIRAKGRIPRGETQMLPIRLRR